MVAGYVTQLVVVGRGVVLSRLVCGGVAGSLESCPSVFLSRRFCMYYTNGQGVYQVNCP